MIAHQSDIQKLRKNISALITLIFLFTTLNGAVRKWIFPNNNAVGNIIQFVQLIIPFSFLLFLFNKHIISPFKKFPFLYAYIFVLILLMLNPMNLTIYHSILGFTLHFGFWWMILFYFANRDFFDEKSLYKIVILFCVVQIVLGAIQYNLPDTHFLNQYADSNTITAVAKVGDRVRITGTFSYLGGIGSFMVFYALVLWTMLRRGVNNQLIAFFLVAGLVLSFMTGSRGITYGYILILLLMLMGEYRSSKNIRKLFLQIGVFLFAVIFVNFFLGDRLGIVSQANTAWDTFSGRVEMNRNSGEEASRFSDPFMEVINFHGKYPAVGVGLGATYQGATGVFGTSPYVTEYGYYESEWARIIIEGGFVLFVMRIFLYVLIFQNLRMPVLSRTLLVLFIFSMPIITHIYNAIYVFLGLVILDKTYYTDLVPDKTSQSIVQTSKRNLLYAGE